jgi:hypothetical protein
MSGITNQELVNKAAITTDAIAASGKLNAAQSDKFIDYVIDETSMKNNARIVRFRNETLDVDKIGVGSRVAMPAAEAQDPGRRVGITTSKITLTPHEIIVPFEIGDSFKEHNIEGDDIEDTIIRLMATVVANNLEELYVLGDTVGPATLASNLPGGPASSTQYVLDTYLALISGWSRQADSGAIVDAQGAAIGHNIFSRLLRALPTKFRRNKAALRWYMSSDLWSLYVERLAARATGAGDRAIEGMAPNPQGIKAVEVPLWPFQPPVVEHVTLNATTAVALRHSPVSSVVVTPTTIGLDTPTTPYVESTDYTLDATAGTIARIALAGITDGQTVKVTYNAQPQIILTPMQNLLIAIGRDIRIEKDRDIFKRVNQYAITLKVDCKFEEITAVAKARNLGLAL